VTDAHIALGNLRAESMSGGIVADREAAEGAVARLATVLGAAPLDVARAMLAGADAAMARALRRVSVERGVDPRRCALVAFGGGGPLHACALAEQLGMRRVLVPPFAGVLSALGLALAPERREAIASLLKHADEIEPDDVSRICEVLEARAGGGSRREWWARARYEGQGHELEVSCYPGDTGEELARRFAAAHEARYGFKIDQRVQIVSVRHAAIGEGRAARLERRGTQEWNAEAAVDRGARLDVELRGPATVALPDATMLVAKGWTANPLQIGGWLMERDS
jgi:N-methylhydantoinase A